MIKPYKILYSVEIITFFWLDTGNPFKRNLLCERICSKFSKVIANLHSVKLAKLFTLYSALYG